MPTNLTFNEYVPLLKEFCLSEGLPEPEELQTVVTPAGSIHSQLTWRWRPMTGFNVDIVPFLTFQDEDPEEYVMALKLHFAQFGGKPQPEFPDWKAFLARKFEEPTTVTAAIPEPKGQPIDAILKGYFNVIQTKTYYPANAFPTLISSPSEGYIHTTPAGKKWIVVKPTPFATWLFEAK